MEKTIFIHELEARHDLAFSFEYVDIVYDEDQYEKGITPPSGIALFNNLVELNFVVLKVNSKIYNNY